MNVQTMKDFVEAHQIVMMKADKTKPSPVIDNLLITLGNKTKQIPFYAIFPAGEANKPVVMYGLHAGPGAFIEKLKQVGGAGASMAANTAD